ncbi:MAG: galactonate dehydratase [Thermomicrobiales bacterium]
MRVTGVETFLCAADWRNLVFVRVETDEGLHGWGEATLEGKEQTVAAATDELARYLIGKDPAQIERHWHQMYETPFWRGGPVLGSAIAGLDQALWDIKGKALGVPVYELLGGAARDRIRYYANGWFHDAKTIDEIAAAARAAVAAGATALKWDPFGAASLFITTEEIHAAVDCVAAVREAVGPTVDLLIEVHGRLSPANAIRVARQLERYDPFFYEEPVPPENMSELALVARATSIPIASGERAFSKHDFRLMFEQQAVAYCQPDPCHAGGITEMKKIAAMAEAYHIGFAPHNPNGPVATRVCQHLAAACPNFTILEWLPVDVPWRDAAMGGPFEVGDGTMPLPEGPGLGIELDINVLRANPYVSVEMNQYNPARRLTPRRKG